MISEIGAQAKQAFIKEDGCKAGQQSEQYIKEKLNGAIESIARNAEECVRSQNRTLYDGGDDGGYNNRAERLSRRTDSVQAGFFFDPMLCNAKYFLPEVSWNLNSTRR